MASVPWAKSKWDANRYLSLRAEGWVLGWSQSSPLMARADGRVVIVTGVVLVAIVNVGVGVVVIVCGCCH